MVAPNSDLDKDFPPLQAAPDYEAMYYELQTRQLLAAPNHSEAAVVMFASWYTQEGQQRNITLRANSIQHMAELDTELSVMTASKGWATTPQGYPQERSGSPQTSATRQNEEVYEDIPGSDPHKGPLKLEVQTIEMKRTSSQKPYLKVGVSHPEMKWPVPAWFDTFKDKPEVVTNCYLGVVMPKDKIPASIKYALLDKVPNKKKGGALEWAVIGFSA